MMIQMPPEPEEVTGQNVLIRMIDSIKFRYQVATHDLETNDFSFKASENAMTLGELLKHVYDLQKGIFKAYSQKEASAEDVPPDLYIKTTIAVLDQTRAQLLTMSKADIQQSTFHHFSSWHIINGPIADTLTHIGQINLMRRMLGKPTPKANILAGTFETENS